VYNISLSVLIKFKKEVFMESSTNSPCCFDSLYFNYKGPKIVIETIEPLEDIIFIEIENEEYSLDQAKKTYEVFLKSMTAEEAEEILPLEGRVEEVPECFNNLEDKTISVIKEECEKDIRAIGIIEKIATFLGLGAMGSGLGAFGVESIIGMVAYSGTAVTQGTSWFALTSQYLTANFIGNSAAVAVATKVPLLGLTGAVASNAMLGLGVICVGTRAGEKIYNRFVAKTPEQEITIDLTKSATKFLTSQLGFDKLEIEEKPKEKKD
jgi:hypothetical protein